MAAAVVGNSVIPVKFVGMIVFVVPTLLPPFVALTCGAVHHQAEAEGGRLLTPFVIPVTDVALPPWFTWPCTA